MNEIQQTTLWLGATRYYMGRMTYAVGEFCDLLIAEWPNLSERARFLIRRDLTEEMKRDDDDRAEGKDYKRLGNDCDRDAWDKVAALWANVEVRG